MLHANRSAAASEALSFVLRDACITCSGTALDEVWSGAFTDEPTRTWLAHHLYAGDPLAELHGARFRLVRCRSCRTTFHANVLAPGGLARLYGAWIDGRQIEAFEASSTGGAPHRQRFDAGRQLVKHLLRLHQLAGSPYPLRLLDFGCGDGRALSLARGLGIETWGVDFSATRTGRTEARIHPTLEAAERAGARGLDAVTLFQVLEHLVDPLDVLRAIHRALRPGGVLLIEVPDATAAAHAPRSFEEFRLVQPLEHLNAFTPVTLERIAVAAGFEPMHRPPAHATTGLREVVRAEISRFVQRPRTSAYFRRR